jgi:putative ATPase
MGLPEGLIALDELAIYLSLAPKSNSLELAGMAADRIIQQTGTLPVPRAFRNSVTRVGKQLGYGNGYEYDHDSPGAYSAQEHLPKQLEGTEFYHPTNYGKEKLLAERLAQLKLIKKEKNG